MGSPTEATDSTGTPSVGTPVCGRRAAPDGLLSLVYDDLRALAEARLRRERRGHTLQPTAVVHEAYLRLLNQSQVVWQDRAHFLAVAAQMIRRVLVDHARRQLAAKRGARTPCTSLLDGDAGADCPRFGLLDLHENLEALAALHARQARVVELRFFGGLTVRETARVLQVSPETVKLDWRVARAWLRERLDE